MRIGVQTNPERKLADELERCAEEQRAGDGFDFVEILPAAPGAALETTDWAAIASQVDELGLPVHCQAPGYLPIANPSPLVRQAALDELRRAIDATARIGATLLSIPWRGWPGFMPESEGYRFSSQWLSILVRHGRDRNVDVALINSPDNRHQLKHFREIYHRTPGLRFTYNVGNSHVGVPQSLTRDYLFALADRLSLVHISDNDGTAPQHLPFGAPVAGGISLAHELRTLRSFRYDGDITLQVLGDRRWLHASRDTLRAAWEKAA